MAFTGNYVCTSFKQELATKQHDLATDVFKIALYTSLATLNAATTVYSATNETSGTGYSAGGVALAGNAVTVSGTTVMVTFTNPTWAGATISFRGALIYNSSAGNKAVLVLDFGADKSYTAALVTIQLPTADVSNALLRL